MNSPKFFLWSDNLSLIFESRKSTHIFYFTHLLDVNIKFNFHTIFCFFFFFFLLLRTFPQSPCGSNLDVAMAVASADSEKNYDVRANHVIYIQKCACLYWSCSYLSPPLYLSLCLSLSISFSLYLSPLTSPCLFFIAIIRALLILPINRRRIRIWAIRVDLLAPLLWMTQSFLLLLHLVSVWLADWLTDWPADWLTSWLTDQLTDWPADWLTSWLTD